MATNQRLIIAQLAREQKEVLFGAFSNTITKKSKEKAWEDIRRKAIAAGCKNLEERAWDYVRDNIWGATRRDTMAKVDKSKKSGEGSVQFTETDNIVLDIVGRESAVVKGLDVKDSEEKMTSQGLEEEEEEEKIETKIMPPGTSAAGSTFRGGSTPNLGGKGGKRGGSESNIGCAADIDFEIKKAKLTLLQEQIEGQRLTNAKLRSEALSRPPSVAASVSYALEEVKIGHEPSIYATLEKMRKPDE